MPVPTPLDDVARTLELPEGAAKAFRSRDPFASGAALPKEFRAGETARVSLAPFQVVSLELTPA